MLPDDPLVKGYYMIHNVPVKEGNDKQDAATHGLLFDAQGNLIKDEHIIAIDTSRMNNTNNTVEKVLKAVRSTLEADIERRAKLSQDT